MNDDQPIRSRPRTRLVDNWPFLYSVEPGGRDLVMNVPRPAPGDPPVESGRITQADWPFEAPGRVKRVKLSPGAIDVTDLLPPAPF